jgi:hypothetical protein
MTTGQTVAPATIWAALESAIVAMVVKVPLPAPRSRSMPARLPTTRSALPSRSKSTTTIGEASFHIVLPLMP